MTKFIELFIAYLHAILGKLNQVQFELYGQSVSLLFILLSFIIIAIFASVLWKGAKY